MDGKFGETKSNLVDYGIQSEESDIRIHICPETHMAYVYPTRCGIDAFQSGNFDARAAGQRGVVGVTANGYPIPPSAIKDCFGIDLFSSGSDATPFSESDTTTCKGNKAVRVAQYLIKNNNMPDVGNSSKIVTDRQKQFGGVDLITNRNIKIQVKCDYRGGRRDRGGTGNLYIQTQERNPKKNH